MTRQRSTFDERVAWLRRRMPELVKQFASTIEIHDQDWKDAVAGMKRDGLLAPKTYWADVKVFAMLLAIREDDQR